MTRGDGADLDQDGREVWSEARLLAHFDALGVAYEIHRHPPLHTVAESQELRGALPGAHVKNMFLKGKKGELWLVTCLEDRQIHVRDLEKRLGAQKMSFGKPELLWETLGVRPGAVTPVAVVNDDAPAAIPEQARGQVRVALDAAIEAAETVNFHPLHNEATVAMATRDLVRLLEEAGHPPLRLDFEELERLAVEREARKA